MNIQTKTVPEQLCFCVADDVTQEEIAFFAQRAVGPLYETLKTAGLDIAGDLEFICPEWNDQGKSRLIIAVPVKSETPPGRGSALQPRSPYFFWESPAFKCAWIDHKGSMPSLKSAWAAFGPAVAAAGFEPVATRSWREVYKHWESFHSENNITELQLEIA